jgi:CubicO group peptidase (beta-lactamase class C family)
VDLDAQRLTVALSREVPGLMESWGTVAAAVAVTDDRGVRVSWTCGKTTRYEARHVEAYADLYASVALMQCAEEGRLTLQLPFEQWLGQGVGLPAGFGRATAWHVLAGLVPDASRVAARLVEAVTGMKYAEYLHHMVFAPLGLNGTRVEPEPRGLLTSVDDQALLLRALVHGGGDVLAARTVAGMVRPQGTEADRLAARGLGVDLGGRGDGEWYGTGGVCSCKWMGTARAYPGMGVTVAAADYSVMRGVSTRLVEVVEAVALAALAEQRGELVGSGRR